MGDTIQDLYGTIKNMFEKQKDASVKKQDLLKEMRDILTRARTISSILSSDDVQTFKLEKYYNEVMKDRSKGYAQAYLNFYAKLSTKAKRTEDVLMMSSLTFAVTQSISILSDLVDNLDKYIGVTEINEHNMKISHAGVLNFVYAVRHICNFTVFMFCGIMSDISPSKIITPKYRILYLEHLNDNMAVLVNNIVNYNIFKDTVSSIDELQKMGKDLFIINTDTKSDNGDLAKLLQSNLTITFPFHLTIPNIFLMLGRTYHDIVHWWNTRNLKEKEWMETRVALLRLQLDNVDPSSPEYAKLSDVVLKYDNIITEYDAKLKKYFTEL